MQRVFKHPQIFTDLLTLSQMYYPMHHNLPKPFRYAVGERILAELAECMRLVVLANSVDKGCSQERAKGANYVRQVRAGVEVIRGWMLLGWKLKLLSHGAIAELATRLVVSGRDADRWPQWLDAKPQGAAAPTQTLTGIQK